MTSQIQIEVNGKKQNATVEQLRTLVSRRFIKPDAKAWLGENETTVAEILKRFPAAEGQTTPEGTVPTPIVTAAGQEKVVVPPAFSAPSGNNSKKSGGFKFLGVGAIILVALIAAIAAGYYGGSRKSKTAPESGETASVQKTEGQKSNETADVSAANETATESGNSTDPDWVPFDRNWKTIPKSYVGSRCPVLYKEISGRYAESEDQRARGEFETQEEYQARIEREGKAIEQGLIAGKVHFGSTVGFPLPSEEDADNSSSFSARYDVDHKTWTLVVNFLEPGIHAGDGDSLLLPLCFSGTSEKYKAVNGFNAQFEVTKSTIDGYGVCVEVPRRQDDQGKTATRYGRFFDLALNDVPLEFAKEKKGNLSGYCVCDLVYKRPYYNSDHLDPTFSSPSEIDMYKHYPCVENVEFWFYDKTTGDVFAKFSLDEALSKESKNFANATETTKGAEPEVASNASLPKNRNRPGRRNPPTNRSQQNGGMTAPPQSDATAGQADEKEVANVSDKADESGEQSESSAADPTSTASQAEHTADSNVGFNESNGEEEDDLESKIDSFDASISQEDEKKLEPEKVFDRTWESIPESYDANNCTGLYYAISSRYGDVEKQRSKGEFETTSEFRARMKRAQKNIANTVISGDVRFGSTVAFPLFPDELKSPHFGKIKTSYNADKKRWVLTVDFVMSVGVNGENNVSWLNIPIYLNGEKETYTGVNGFKMEVEVTKWLLREYGVQVEFPRLKNFSGSYTNGFETLSFVLGSVPVEVARDKKGHVGGFCVCDVDSVEPCFEWFYIKPKFTSPYGFDVYRRFIVVRNLEFWFYDMKTREVIAKYSLEEASRGKIKTYGEATNVAGRNPKDAAPTDEEAEPVPTWDEVFSAAVDTPESWESKKPTITIPDDAASLEEALAKSAKGDVILVRATEKPVPLKGKKAARGESSEVTIDHAVAIVGESGENGSAIVELDAEETLRINSRDLVAFKGTTFSTKKSPSAKDVTPQIFVANDSKAKFKNCVFQGNGVEEASGVVVEGEFAVASFWKCQFQQFGIDGLRVQDSAKTTVEFCQFLAKNRYGLSSLSGAEVKVDRSQFDGNVTGFQAEGGGGVVVSNSFFSGNRSNWSISSGSMRSCDTKEGNVIEK